jgi:hypothetical protein
MPALVQSYLVATANEWAQSNYLLPKNAIGLESDTGLAKIGDGASRWGNISYMATGWGVTIPGGTYTGSVNFARHIHGTVTLPTLAVSAGAGSNPPTPAVTTGSTDLGGTITWGTGTSPNTQTQLAVTFGVPWTIPGGGGPHVVVTPINSATQALGLYVSGISPTGFNVNVASSPAAGQGASTYQFCYSVMG